MNWATIDSPCGPITIVSGPEGVEVITFEAITPAADWVEDPGLEAARQLREYFAGERTTFELALAPAGTEFQRAVWAALVEIPYGGTTTYGALAQALGRPNASRAVGAANGRNPIAVVVPCHRVIGADGSLTGYAGGLDRKRTLLELEKRARQTALF